jgi:hypothetical protein
LAGSAATEAAVAETAGEAPEAMVAMEELAAEEVIRDRTKRRRCRWSKLVPS